MVVPSKYEELCNSVRTDAKADAGISIVLNVNTGEVFRTGE